MKFFDDDSTTAYNAHGFGFSGVRPETLGATEYTLVTLVLDKTGSVDDYAAELAKIKSTVVESCKLSARADFLLLRVVEFNSQVDEVHGFIPVSTIDTAQYTVPKCEGLTALRDAYFSAVSATNAYAKTLSDQEYLVNGIVIVVTDGDDNRSRVSAADVKRQIAAAVKGEQLESIRTILVGVNAAQYQATLESFQTEVGIDQYEDIGQATPATLAKLANFVSQSISSQSQSLGTGGASQAIVF